MYDPNLVLLETAAAKLAPLLSEIVFIGGCATGLLITDPGAADVRETYDVDVIAEIASYAEYGVFSDRLRELGFTEDSREGAPLCRWVHDEMILDVMPLDAGILGFSNRWYAEALATSADVSLPNGLTIRAITAPFFLGTKMEAFRARGNGDYFASHDLEDFIAVVDGRSTLIRELQDAAPKLRTYLTEEVKHLLTTSRFLDALPGFLPADTASQSRIGSLYQKLQGLARIG